METVLIKAAQLILSLSILIILHEMGHFFPAKWFKCRVEKFYLFFDPWFSAFKKKIGETEYGIGWLPLGGYVKIAGMIDESMDKEQMQQEPQPYEFRSKPAWQRLIIMLGGVTVNLILGVVIFSAMLWYWGESFIPAKNVKYGVTADSLAQKIGIQDGDILLSADGKAFKSFESIPNEMALNSTKVLQVNRNGQLIDLNIPSGFYASLIDNKLNNFIDIRLPTIIGKVEPGSVADKIGLKVGQQILNIDQKPCLFFDQLKKTLPQYKNATTSMQVLNTNGDTLSLNVKFNDPPLLGIYNAPLDSIFNVEVKEYGLLNAIPEGTKKATKTLSNYVKNLKLLFDPEVKGYKQVGGFIAIGNMFKPKWDWHAFWQMTGILSIILAFMNVLPIPALDGGHALFCIYEMITGRKPNDKFLEYAQYAGMIFLLSLLLFANGSDIIKLFIK